jgi:Zn-dependent protease with chaperone function
MRFSILALFAVSGFQTPKSPAAPSNGGAPLCASSRVRRMLIGGNNIMASRAGKLGSGRPADWPALPEAKTLRRRYTWVMFNLFGIFLSVMIYAAARGNGIMVGWESPVAVVAAVLATFLLHRLFTSYVLDRWHLTRLRLAAAREAGLDRIASELALEQEDLQRRLPLMRLMTDALVLVGFLTVALAFGWVDFVSRVLGVPAYLDLLPSLLPYLLMLAATWVGQHRLEHVIRGGDWTLWRYLGFQSRTNLMTLSPIVLIYAAYWAAISLVPGVGDLRLAFRYVEVGMQFVLVMILMLFVPLVVRGVVRSSPLPAGRLRRRLEAFARDRGLRISQILVWRTGTTAFATAFVIGLIAPFRYVFITDGLLKRLNEDEILAVFAHELGHVHHRHLWYLLAFIISFSIVMIGVLEGLVAPLGVPQLEFMALGGLILYAYFIIGYISRRFERQADAYAARHTSPELLARVFLKLGLNNPVAMKKDGWRHFSLERRVRELMLARDHPQVQRIFSAELRSGILVAVFATLAGAALMFQPVREDVVTGMATFSLTQYDRARVASADHSRVERLRERTLERAAAMSRLDAEGERYARWYTAIVATLTGEESDEFPELLADVRRQRDAAASDDQRRRLERFARQVEASETSARRAYAQGTPFFAEFEEELRRKGWLTEP